MKKFVSLITVLLLVVFCLAACGESPKETGTPPVQETEASPKDADYLYDWLTQHGTLVDGTCLQYSGTDKNGTKYTLSYDTSYVDKLRWQVQCSTKDASGRTIITQLFLFYDSDKAMSQISVHGSGAFDDYYRTLEFYHDPAIFTKNSPIEHGDLNGSTVHVPDSEKALIKEILTLNHVCEENAQKNLCVLLDWLKYSFCPTANMAMSDFGYDKY